MTPATASRAKAHSACLGIVSLLAILFTATGSPAQEPPYFVTYSDYMEEQGNLEVAFKGAWGTPDHGNSFRSGTLEFEYGALGWWTTEVYLSGQSTSNDSTIFTGYRWENRFRPLPREYFINPVFYVEYEAVNFADRSFLEVTGHATQQDLLIPNASARQVVERALETKLILSGNVRGWNFSENFIAEKALNESDPWEFGYALGVSRPLANAASVRNCIFCRERFIAAAEMFGGLGDTNGFGIHATSQYLGPIIAYDVPRGPTIAFSTDFGLNDNSVPRIYRIKISYEFEQIFRRKASK
ncbi:MAG TPA: hypothetical protein VMT56_01685 [Candidatus Bathyarchaeia archaeon]|nr:hypothetical protein [Candidatus Bathyarchaeia archaeon]